MKALWLHWDTNTFPSTTSIWYALWSKELVNVEIECGISTSGKRVGGWQAKNEVTCRLFLKLFPVFNHEKKTTMNTYDYEEEMTGLNLKQRECLEIWRKKAIFAENMLKRKSRNNSQWLMIWKIREQNLTATGWCGVVWWRLLVFMFILIYFSSITIQSSSKRLSGNNIKYKIETITQN